MAHCGHGRSAMRVSVLHATLGEFVRRLLQAAALRSVPHAAMAKATRRAARTLRRPDRRPNTAETCWDDEVAHATLDRIDYHTVEPANGFVARTDENRAVEPPARSIDMLGRDVAKS